VPRRQVYCGARAGDYFELKGEMLTLPPGQGLSIYSLAAVLPLLAAKQRPTHPNDWMTTDAEIACPDPNCQSRLRIVRTGLRRFCRSETTAVPLDDAEGRMTRSSNLTNLPLDIRFRASSRWLQLAGGHGAIDRDHAVDDLIAAFDAGVFTFDCADIYTGVEELYGQRGRGSSRRAAPGPRTACACTRSLCPTFQFSDNRTTRCRSDHRPFASTTEDGAARSGAVPLLGLC